MHLTAYMYGNNWVFDEPGVCEKEPFVFGSTDIITRVAKDKGIKNVKKRLLNITFDKEPLPEYDCKMVWTHKEANGNWYHCPENEMKGWLCPMLLYFFEKPPKEIYFFVEDGGQAPEIKYEKELDKFTVADVALESEEGTIVSWEDLEERYELDRDIPYDDYEDDINDPFSDFQEVQAFLELEESLI